MCRQTIGPGKTKEIKCVIWDLDNTIWDGTLLENDMLVLKPGIVDVLKSLDERGILHSIASRNDYDTAMQKLVEFGIADYFLYPEINWGAKSASISAIRQNLNIAMDSLLFIDDQPYELDEVSRAHQDVICIDAACYRELPLRPELNPRFITEDSIMRRRMYQDDVLRKSAEERYDGPSEEFLASLDMEFVISEASLDDLARAEELTVRTNQLNATGKTYDYDELNRFRLSDSHRLYICGLTDRYGPYGKIGLALIEILDGIWHLRLLLMSCRVMSRGVGTVLLSYIMNQAKQAGCVLRADFRDTGRNRAMLVSYKFANFKEMERRDNGDIIFENDLSLIQKYPPYIKLIV